MALNDRIEKYQETLKERNEKFEDWYKNLITISVGLLGLIITFAPKSNTQSQFLLYALSLCTLSLGILTAVISSYASIDALNKILIHKGENILRVMDGKSAVSGSSGPAKMYLVLRRISYFLYCSAIILLVIYAILNNR